MMTKFYNLSLFLQFTNSKNKFNKYLIDKETILFLKTNIFLEQVTKTVRSND